MSLLWLIIPTIILLVAVVLLVSTVWRTFKNNQKRQFEQIVAVALANHSHEQHSTSVICAPVADQLMHRDSQITRLVNSRVNEEFRIRPTDSVPPQPPPKPKKVPRSNIKLVDQDMIIAKMYEMANEFHSEFCKEQCNIRCNLNFVKRFERSVRNALADVK